MLEYGTFAIVTNRTRKIVVVKANDKTVFQFWRTREYKGKAVPLQAWRGPEGSVRLRLPDFKTIGT